MKMYGNVREDPRFDNWTDEKKEMLGQKGLEIETIGNGDYWIYRKDKSNFHCFPHWAVAPCYEDEEETLSGKEVTVTINGVEHVAVIK